METMKKQWGKPLTGVQEFMPQEFIAACDPDEDFVKYEFWCNAGNGTTFNVYYDIDKDGVFDSEDESAYIGNFYACRESHSVTVHKGENVDNIFPYGFIGRYEWVGWEREYRTYPVRIWRGEDGDNIHCTTKLNVSEWTVANPS